MHNHKDGKDVGNEHKGMMWMMLVCCLIPVLFLFGGTTFLKTIGFGWMGVAIVVGFLVFYVWNMFKKYGSTSPDNQKKDNLDSTKHKDCCH